MTATAEKTELPLWQCHKKVRAAKIVTIFQNQEGQCGLLLEHNGERSRKYVDWRWLNRHRPKQGGYYVEYSDGYTSYSPAEAFEDGYMLID